MRMDLLIIASSMMLAAASAAVAIVILIMKKPEWLSWRPRANFGAGRAVDLPASAGDALAPEFSEEAETGGRAGTPLMRDEESRLSPSSLYAENDADDDESETPEAALTMNLINKKRDAKKETMRAVMQRVHRRENPRQIAESLHVGMGEVTLAMALSKLKK